METRYEIVNQIGKGGNSEVYKAFDRHLNRYVAIKRIHKEEGHFFQEAKILKQLKHPAIPVIYDIFREDGNNCIIMEYMEGRNLLSVLENGEPVGEENAIRIGIRLSECLQYLHRLPQKIIYRDLKPANILIDETGKIKLIDFDSAFMGNEREGKRMWSGTYGYSAPEQFEAKQEADERSDIYGLGTTMYHLLTGQNPSKPPYHLYKIGEINPLISEELEKVVEKCMSEEKEGRYGNMEEVIDGLTRCGKMPKRRRCIKKWPKKRYMVEQKKNILLTGKAGGGLFVMLAFMCILTFFTGFVYGKNNNS
ncbi:MAG: serine/threonine protein kinase, partial [Lachnospiraceae bacterium]|nr:serine/threonine protein kinase [Lachnospiraceae bacterium]